jgi:hypothetical protein
LSTGALLYTCHTGQILWQYSVFFTPKALKGAGAGAFCSSQNPFLNLSPAGSAKNGFFIVDWVGLIVWDHSIRWMSSYL